jgi:hypothetical protein
MRSILDESFHYTSSVHTDLKKTFARIHREQRQQGQAIAETKLKVSPIRQSETTGAGATRIPSRKL